MFNYSTHLNKLQIIINKKHEKLRHKMNLKNSQTIIIIKAPPSVMKTPKLSSLRIFESCLSPIVSFPISSTTLSWISCSLTPCCYNFYRETWPSSRDSSSILLACFDFSLLSMSWFISSSFSTGFISVFCKSISTSCWICFRRSSARDFWRADVYVFDSYYNNRDA